MLRNKTAKQPGINAVGEDVAPPPPPPFSALLCAYHDERVLNNCGKDIGYNRDVSYYCFLSAKTDAFSTFNRPVLVDAPAVVQETHAGPTSTPHHHRMHACTKPSAISHSWRKAPQQSTFSFYLSEHLLPLAVRVDEGVRQSTLAPPRRRNNPLDQGRDLPNSCIGPVQGLGRGPTGRGRGSTTVA